MEANEADLAAAGAAAPGRPGSGGDSGNGNASQPARKSARSRAPSGRVRAASEEALDEGGGEAQPSSRSMRGASGCGSGDRAGSSGSSGDLGSEDLATDDAAACGPKPKISRRVMANRESAQRSRMRKLQYIADLEANVSGLNDQVSALAPQLTFLKAQHAGFGQQNDELRAEVSRLLQESQYKESLNDALQAELKRVQTAQLQRLPAQPPASDPLPAGGSRPSAFGPPQPGRDGSLSPGGGARTFGRLSGGPPGFSLGPPGSHAAFAGGAPGRGPSAALEYAALIASLSSAGDGSGGDMALQARTNGGAGGRFQTAVGAAPGPAPPGGGMGFGAFSPTAFHQASGSAFSQLPPPGGRYPGQQPPAANGLPGSSGRAVRPPPSFAGLPSRPAPARPPRSPSVDAARASSPAQDRGWRPG